MFFIAKLAIQVILIVWICNYGIRFFRVGSRKVNRFFDKLLTKWEKQENIENPNDHVV